MYHSAYSPIHCANERLAVAYDYGLGLLLDGIARDARR
jgi:hypothetical protein